jgi:salicylate hydroxylase
MDGLFDAVIAGGGIAGLTAALACEAHGLGTCVFERDREPTTQGAGIQLGPNAVKVLVKLGLEAELEQCATRIERIHIRDGLTAESLAQIPLGDIAHRRHGAPYLVIHRADLLRLLYDAVRAKRAITFKTGREVKGFGYDNGAVVARTAPASQIAGRIMAGADGIWSAVREPVVKDGPPRASGRMAWRTLLEMNRVPEQLRGDETALWLLPGAHLVHYPLRSGTVLNVVAITPGDTETLGWSQPGDTAVLAGHFSAAAAQLHDLADQVSDWRTWPLYDRAKARCLAHDRAALLGDAGHPMVPFLAQGGAMAIEDGYVLAACLARRPDEPARALAAYDAARRGRTGRVQAASRRQMSIYHASGPVRLARNAYLRALWKTAPDRLLSRFDWLYGHDVTAGS